MIRSTGRLQFSASSQDPVPDRVRPAPARRLLQVRQNWTRGWQWATPNIVFRETQRTCLFVATFLALVLVCVDLIWWSPGERVQDLGRQPLYVVTCILLYLLSASLLDRYLRTLGPTAIAVRPGVAAARFAAAGIPVAGLLAIPAWRWISQNHPRRLGRPSLPDGEHLMVRGGRFSSWRRRLGPQLLGQGATWPRGASPGFAFVLLLEIGFGLLLIPLCAPAASSWSRWLLAAALTTLLHLAAGGAALATLVLEARKLGLTDRGAVMLMSPALLWLLPIPLASLLGVAFLVILDSIPALHHRERTLVHRANDRSGSLLRRGPWNRLHREIARSPKEVPWFQLIGLQLGELERPREATRADRKVARLRRWTLALLPFETALVSAWWLTWAGPANLGYGEALRDLSRDLAIGALLGAALIQVLRRRDRLPEPRWAFAAGLLVSTGWVGLLAALGLEVGLGLALGSVERTGQALGIGGGVGLALTVFRIQLRAAFPPLPGSSEEDDRFALILFAVFLLLVAFWVYSLEGLASREAAQVLELAVAIVPLTGVLRALGPIRSLVYPYSVIQVFSPRVSWRIRLRLFVLAACGLLLFGGVTVPAWDVLRRRLWEVPPRPGSGEGTRPSRVSVVSGEVGAS